MIDLVIDPHDPALKRLGVAADGSSYRPWSVSIVPSRPVRLTAGGFLSSIAPAERHGTGSAAVTVSVPATDGTEILAADRSTFTYRVTVTAQDAHGRTGRERTVQFAGLLPSSLGASTSVANLITAQTIDRLGATLALDPSDPPANGEVPVYDAATQTWKPGPAGTGGTGGAVTSVAGRTGAVVLAAADLSNSTATGRALITAADAAAARSTVGAAAFSHQHWAEDIFRGGGAPLPLDTIPTGTTGSTVALGNHTHVAANVTDLAEAVDDRVAALVKAGTGITLVYDDAAGTFTITSTAGGGTTDPEVVRDTIGGALVAGAGIQITVNDAGDTITIVGTDASTSAKGIVQLAGDLAGTAAAPTVPGLAGKANTSHTHAAADVSSGTFAIARIPTGTTGSTVALGNHTHNPASLGAATSAQGAKADTALQPDYAQAINAQTGTSYTLVASDAGKVVTLSNTGAITLNAPGSVFTAGQRVDVVVINTGMATVVGTSGATANGTPSLVSRARWSAFTILWTSATTCVVIGDMA